MAAYNAYGYGYGYGYGTPGMGDANGAGTGGAYNPRYHFAAAQEAGFDIGGDETQPRTLYVGNLDQSVTEDFIATLFGQFGPVTKIKVVHDGQNDPYAFVEFAEHYSASQALSAMNKRNLLNKEMKVNWAAQPGSTQVKVDTSKHYHVFVGDLSPEVDNKTLKEAFAPFGTISDAKVIRDLATLKSKGYGFVSFPKKEEAERAIESMNGQWLGRRTIRTSWATRGGAAGGGPGTGGPMGGSDMKFDEVMGLTTATNATVYVGGITATTPEEAIRAAFGKYGKVADIRIFRAQGYAFVRFESKEAAAHSICNMNGADVAGQTVRCSWGRANVTYNPQSGGYANAYQTTSPASDDSYTSHSYGAATAGAAGAGGTASAAQAAQYWQNYYQQCYNNPQMMQQMQQWQSYWQSQGGDASAQGGGGQSGQ